jgi:hypothetical protein
LTTHVDLMLRLDAHLARAARRVRMRRLVVMLSVAGIVLGILGAGFASLEGLIVATEGGATLGQAAGLVRPLVIVALLVAVAITWTRGVARPDLAREVDERLGLSDRTASALAVAGGEVASSLGERLIVETADRLDAVAGGIDQAFPARPRRSVLALLRTASVVVALWVAVILVGRLIGSGGGGQSIEQLPGAVAAVDDEPDEGSDAEPLPPDVVDEPDEAEDPEPEPEPDMQPPEPEPEPEPPAPPLGPLATADLVLSATEFDEGDPVLSLAVGKPGAGLTAARGFSVTVEVDGKPLGTGLAMALSPADAEGGILPLRMGRLPGGPELLKPGQHEAVLVLEPEGGGAAIRSEPKSFRIRGGDDGDGGGSPPPPKPEPEPEAQPEPPPPPEAQPPDGGAEEEGEPEEGPPPAPPEDTEKKVVLPLFEEGLEIEKVGQRMVLVPGGGPDDPPRRMTLEEAWEEALRRAETAVDRAGVRASDRDLVRRYFERLRTLMDSQK